MKKSFFMVLMMSFVMVFNFSLISAEDDPFADMGIPGEPGFDMGSGGADPLDGMDLGAEDTESDPMAGMDAGADFGTDAGGADAMEMGLDAGGETPDMGAAGGDDPFGDMGMDANAGTAGAAGMDDEMFGGMDTGADPFGGMDTPIQQSPAVKTVVVNKQAAPKKTGPAEITTVPRADGFPKTNRVYTGDDKYLGDFPSLKDVVNYRMRASSYLDDSSRPENMSDVYVDSAWVEKKKTGGKGESITIDFEVGSFSGVYEDYSRTAKVREIRFLSGNCKSREDWENSYRPMRLKLLHNNKVIAYINMIDTMNWQTAQFKAPINVKEGDILKAEFVDVFPPEGARRENDKRIAITEIAIIGDLE